MNPRLRLAAIGAPVLLAVLVVAFYLVDHASHRGRVPRAVTAAGVELGGSTPDEAQVLLTALGERLVSSPIDAHVNGGSAPVLPRDLGLSLDIEGMLDEAVSIGREGGIVGSFQRWWRSIGTATEVGLRGVVDEDILLDALDDLAQRIVGEAPFPGSITVVDGRLVAEYPRDGLSIDPATAAPRLLAAFLLDPHPSVELDLVPSQPRLTAAHIDAAMREAERLLAGGVTLVPPTDSAPLVLTVEDLQDAFRADVVPDGNGHRMAVTFDQAILIGKIAPIALDLATDPINAEFVFDEEAHLVSITPGVPGTSVDFDGLLGAVIAAATQADRTGILPVIEDVEPEVTTEMLEELGIVHMVSSFTTYHACCEARVTNIQLMADTVSGTLVPPGEVFSLNAVVGERRESDGYLPAGTIVAGELEDTIGGGVSQFSTTLYNAVFWGGYEDVTHTPHSFYFSRYPEGIEATVNWPDLHNKFRNDTDSTIMVRTKHTGTSITVEIWGDNDGRVLWGDQWRGRTTIDVLAPGGPDARIVTAEVSERTLETEPKPKYLPDDTLRPGSSIIDDDGGVGWTVKVTRFVEHRGETTSRQWTVRYVPRPILTRVHTCMLEDEDLRTDWEEVCPPDLPPTVDATGPSSATVAAGASLKAIALDDWDLTLTYAWSGEGVTFATPGAATTNVSFGAAGDYTITVTVTDGAGNTAQDTLAITVTE